MNKILLSNCAIDDRASNKALSELINLSLPDDYLSIFSDLNGWEGFIGDEYLILWKAEDLIKFNKEYLVDKYAPGIFLFGSDGGGEAFGFDTRSKPYKIIQIPFIGMELQEVSFFADSFTHFLEKMRV